MERELSRQAIDMWWEYILIAALLIFGFYCFFVVVGFRTRTLTRKSDRTAESMYGNYGDSNRKQRRFARQHGGQWRDDGGS
jgi:hypothetical protein